MKYRDPPLLVAMCVKGGREEGRREGEKEGRREEGRRERKKRREGRKREALVQSMQTSIFVQFHFLPMFPGLH